MTFSYFKRSSLLLWAENMIAKLFGRGGQSSCVFCDIISSKDMSKIIYEVSISWVLLCTHKWLLLKLKSNQFKFCTSISLTKICQYLQFECNILMKFYEDSNDWIFSLIISSQRPFYTLQGVFDLYISSVIGLTNWFLIDCLITTAPLCLLLLAGEFEL